MKKIITILLTAIIVYSCASSLEVNNHKRIQKRKYNKGWMVQKRLRTTDKSNFVFTPQQTSEPQFHVSIDTKPIEVPVLSLKPIKVNIPAHTPVSIKYEKDSLLECDTIFFETGVKKLVHIISYGTKQIQYVECGEDLKNVKTLNIDFVEEVKLSENSKAKHNSENQDKIEEQHLIQAKNHYKRVWKDTGLMLLFLFVAFIFAFFAVLLIIGSTNFGLFFALLLGAIASIYLSIKFYIDMYIGLVKTLQRLVLHRETFVGAKKGNGLRTKAWIHAFIMSMVTTYVFLFPFFYVLIKMAIFKRKRKKMMR